MSEFLIVSSTFARQPLLAVPLVLGLLVAFGALMLRLQGLAFGEPTRRQRAGAGLLRAAVRASGAGRWSPASTCRRRWSPGSSTSPRCWDEGGRSTMRCLPIHRQARPPGRSHRPWPRCVRRRRRLAERRRGSARRPTGRCSALWGDRRAVHMALRRRRAGRDLRRSASTAPDGRFPSVGRVHPPAIRLERAIARPLRPRRRRRARPAALARPRPLGARASRSGRRRPPIARAPYPFLPVGGRGPAPDPGRPGARRHHRARPFPLHRQRRDRGAARGAARLRAQGHRDA